MRCEGELLAVRGREHDESRLYTRIGMREEGERARCDGAIGSGRDDGIAGLEPVEARDRAVGEGGGRG